MTFCPANRTDRLRFSPKPLSEPLWRQQRRVSFVYSDKPKTRNVVPLGETNRRTGQESLRKSTDRKKGRPGAATPTGRLRAYDDARRSPSSRGRQFHAAAGDRRIADGFTAEAARCRSASGRQDALGAVDGAGVRRCPSLYGDDLKGAELDGRVIEVEDREMGYRILSDHDSGCQQGTERGLLGMGPARGLAGRIPRCVSADPADH